MWLCVSFQIFVSRSSSQSPTRFVRRARSRSLSNSPPTAYREDSPAICTQEKVKVTGTKKTPIKITKETVSTVKPVFRGQSDQRTTRLQGTIWSEDNPSSGDNLIRGQPVFRVTLIRGQPVFKGQSDQGPTRLHGILWSEDNPSSGDTLIRGQPVFRGHSDQGPTRLHGILWSEDNPSSGDNLIRGQPVFKGHSDQGTTRLQGKLSSEDNRLEGTLIRGQPVF